jgi:hypothetical protein
VRDGGDELVLDTVQLGALGEFALITLAPDIRGFELGAKVDYPPSRLEIGGE